MDIPWDLPRCGGLESEVDLLRRGRSLVGENPQRSAMSYPKATSQRREVNEYILHRWTPSGRTSAGYRTSGGSGGTGRPVTLGFPLFSFCCRSHGRPGASGRPVVWERPDVRCLPVVRCLEVACRPVQAGRPVPVASSAFFLLVSGTFRTRHLEHCGLHPST